MVAINYLRPFCDWLSISFAASRSPLTDVLAVLNRLGVVEECPKGRDKTLYDISNVGTLFVTHDDRYHNFSFSGGVLSSLRRLPEFRDLIIALASSPHNITRFDATMDVPVPTPIIIKNFRKSFPDGSVEVCGHKRQIQLVSNFLGDASTGTVYFQNKSYQGNVKLRVYDKQREVLDKLNVEIAATTRYELSIGRGASLRDFQDPTSIFWHYMPETVLKRPSDVLCEPWSPAERVDYDDKIESHTTDYETLRYLIENSVSLRHLVDRCLSVQGGDALLLREVQKALCAR